jgi:hypothetical protein
MGAGLGSVLALGAATGFGQVRTETVAASQVAQFCVPPQENPDAHRFYCRNEDGWSGPNGAAAFACVMQGIEERALSPAIEDALEALRRWQREGSIAQREDVAVGLENAPRTLMRLFSGENFGKQLVKIADAPS